MSMQAILDAMTREIVRLDRRIDELQGKAHLRLADLERKAKRIERKVDQDYRAWSGREDKGILEDFEKACEARLVRL